MTDETTLLREFAAERSESAFTALVRLHANLVFATALRQTGDRGAAEEITQNVFLVLARKPPALKSRATIAGWLYQTTLNQSRMRVRTDLRRQRRENTAAEISMILREGDSIWSSLIPLLDEALLSLNETDRVAVILHYVEERSHREIGGILGVGEDAARKRIHSVIDSLTAWFKKRGFAVSSAALVAGLSTQITSASPALISTCCASFAAPASTISTLAIIMSTKTKIAAVILLALALSAPIAFVKSRVATETPAQVNSPAPAPQNQAPPRSIATSTASPTLPEKTIFQRIWQGDTNLALLSRDQAEAFLQINKTNAESLLTAYRVTHDIDYLRRAATNFPNDPSVVMRAVLHDAFPEQRRAWNDQFKKIDPDNSLASYLSAKDHLQNKEYDDALKDIGEAGNKPAFRDYVGEQIQSLEEIYLAAGHTPAEAKALGMASVEITQGHQLVELSRGMNDLIKQAQASGDSATAEALVQQGLALGNRLQSIPDGGFYRLSQMVGLNMQQSFVGALDPSGNYPFLNGSVPDNLTQYSNTEKSMRADAEIVNQWFMNASESDILTYCDRMKLYGEAGAATWVKQRIVPTP